MIVLQLIKNATIAVLFGSLIAGCGVSISRSASGSESCICKGCEPTECAKCPHCSSGESCAGSCKDGSCKDGSCKDGSCKGSDKHAEKPAKGGCFGSQGTCAQDAGQSKGCGHQH